MKYRQLILSCEHASNHVPADWRELLDDAELLNSHRGWDIGAIELAQYLARRLAAPLHQAHATRLLVDPNRSPRHPQLHGEAIRTLDRSSRQAIRDAYYWPYRQTVETAIRDTIKAHGPVLHLSVHSFTPMMNGVARNADIGLLYDPRRPAEKQLCRQWQSLLKTTAADLRIRRNYPYRGAQDGFTTALRRQFPDAVYAGVELEINQALVGGKAWSQLKRLIVSTLQAIS